MAKTSSGCGSASNLRHPSATATRNSFQRTRRAVAAVVKHESAPAPPLARLDLAQEEDVVAGAVRRVVAALEPRDAAVDQRRVGGAQPVRDARETVDVRPRNAASELDLVVREHVDRVALGRLERGEALGAA